MELETEWFCEEGGTKRNEPPGCTVGYEDFWMCWDCACEKHIREDHTYEDDN